MVTRVGTSVFWEISDDVFTTTTEMNAVGFGDRWHPNNNFSVSLNKAIKTVRREWDVHAFGTANIPKRIKQAKHTRFKNQADEARIAFTVPRVNGNEFSIDVALVIILDKKTGELSFERDTASEADFQDLVAKVRTQYRIERDRVNTDEFRRLVSRYTMGMNGCNGIPLRSSGGVYFIPTSFDDRLEKLKTLFTIAHGTVAKLVSFPMYDDEESSVALEHAATASFEQKMKALIEELAEAAGKEIKQDTFDLKMQKIEALRQQIESFKRQTRGHAEEFNTRMDRLSQAMEAGLANVKDNVVQPFDLMAELDKIQ